MSDPLTLYLLKLFVLFALRDQMGLEIVFFRGGFNRCRTN
jgi:hypothetical protein